jgi:hypothetical protein
VDGLPLGGISLSLSIICVVGVWLPGTGVAGAVFPRGAGKFTTRW